MYQFLVHGFTCGLLKALTCAVDFIKIDCRSSLPIYASPKKLRCEPESSIDRPGAPGRRPRDRQQLAGLKTYAFWDDQKASTGPLCGGLPVGVVELLAVYGRSDGCRAFGACSGDPETVYCTPPRLRPRVEGFLETFFVCI